MIDSADNITDRKIKKNFIHNIYYIKQHNKSKQLCYYFEQQISNKIGKQNVQQCTIKNVCQIVTTSGQF